MPTSRGRNQLDAASGTMACVTPANMSATEPALLRVSLNGQDYTPSALPFAPYATPSVAALSLDHGPTGGATSFVVRGAGLEAGDEVASSGLLKLRSGQPVMIENALKPQAKLAPTPPQG